MEAERSECWSAEDSAKRSAGTEHRALSVRTGAKSVIGGKLTFLPGATLEGGDDLFGQPPSIEPIGYVADSEATTIAALKDDFNALLAALRSCGLMVTGK